jgi:hypothetical protein
MSPSLLLPFLQRCIIARTPLATVCPSDLIPTGNGTPLSCRNVRKLVVFLGVATLFVWEKGEQESDPIVTDLHPCTLNDQVTPCCEVGDRRNWKLVLFSLSISISVHPEDVLGGGEADVYIR